MGQKVYVTVLKAKKYEQLDARIKLKLKNFDANHLQTLMKNAKTNLIKIADEGVHVTFKK